MEKGTNISATFLCHIISQISPDPFSVSFPKNICIFTSTFQASFSGIVLKSSSLFFKCSSSRVMKKDQSVRALRKSATRKCDL